MRNSSDKGSAEFGQKVNVRKGYTILGPLAGRLLTYVNSLPDGVERTYEEIEREPQFRGVRRLTISETLNRLKQQQQIEGGMRRAGKKPQVDRQKQVAIVPPAKVVTTVYRADGTQELSSRAVVTSPPTSIGHGRSIEPLLGYLESAYKDPAKVPQYLIDFHEKQTAATVPIEFQQQNKVKVSSRDDILAECPQVNSIISTSIFTRLTISARNSVPQDRVELFYQAILQVPRDDGYQGARLERFLPFVGSPSSYGFMEWVVQQRNLTGREFDAKLREHTKGRTYT